MPITAIAVLSFSDMASSLSLVPLASLKRWRGRSTAGPSHYRTSGVRPAFTIRRGQGLSFQCQVQFLILNEQVFRILILERRNRFSPRAFLVASILLSRRKFNAQVCHRFCRTRGFRNCNATHLFGKS